MALKVLLVDDHEVVHRKACVLPDRAHREPRPTDLKRDVDLVRAVTGDGDLQVARQRPGCLILAQRNDERRNVDVDDDARVARARIVPVVDRSRRSDGVSAECASSNATTSARVVWLLEPVMSGLL